MPDDHLTVAVALTDEAATLDFGARLAACLHAGMSVWLEGDLGAGKTTLVRGLLRAVGVTGTVRSPTYTLVEVHLVSGLNFYHFDFYRFNQPEDFLDAGLDEYFQGQGVCLVEWPERAAPYLPPADLRIALSLAPDHGRLVRCQTASERGRRCLALLTAVPCSSSPPPA
ncbi:MAG: tRNA (adenosine(37)-N6)-threonylcarbamoyltransferase complex ATPase subunit type 1 TsaE [Betaproteobacteria bacterium HGW-Betaproteobacteria-11]|nr:MAG: tRNA (adenosine(37)-N6)-threonylcarbamoyltransferase complex ATPase subunit type 1 TsaE [Betaproteobacteria bacterium HGW-Betaproteobacteria-11]